MERKIIQVSVSGIDNNANTQSDAVVTALTDSGEVFCSFESGGRWSDWQQLPTLPKAGGRSMKLSVSMWAVVHPSGSINSLSYLREDSRQAFLEKYGAYYKNWRLCYRKGFRVMKVLVQTFTHVPTQGKKPM